jgi:hypothetical protein
MGEKNCSKEIIEEKKGRVRIQKVNKGCEGEKRAFGPA